MNEEEHHARFHDIINGKTPIWFNGERIFCLHPTPQIRSVSLLYHQDWKREAEQRGVLNEDAAKQQAVARGDWSLQKDEEIKSFKSTLYIMRKTYDSITLPSRKLKQDRLIKKEEKKLKELEDSKRLAIGKTSELYASNRSNQELLRVSMVDESLNLIWPCRDQFDELEFEEVSDLEKSYTNTSKMFDETMIQHMVLQDFFYIYMPHCENPTTFFGKPMVELSSFQLKMATYGNIFFNIIQRHDNLSEAAKKSPEQLLAIGSSKKKEDNKNTAGRSDSKTYFGATKEDIDAMTQDGEESITLADKIKELSGGSNTISGPEVAKLFG